MPLYWEHYAGYQHVLAPVIGQLLYENKQHLQMTYQLDNILCTHAGVTEEFLKRSNWDPTTHTICEWINELWKYTPKVFGFGYYIYH